MSNFFSSIGKSIGSLFGGGNPSQSVYDPFKEYRGQYAGELNQMMANPSQYMQTDPSYQYRYQTGLDAVQRAAGATGTLGSGNQMAALEEYGQNFASQEFQNEFNRLGSLAGVGSMLGGQNTTSQLGQGLGSLANIMQLGNSTGLFSKLGGLMGGGAPTGISGWFGGDATGFGDFGSSLAAAGGTDFGAGAFSTIFGSADAAAGAGSLADVAWLAAL
jgi:hypothetical protein